MAKKGLLALILATPIFVGSIYGGLRTGLLQELYLNATIDKETRKWKKQFEGIVTCETFHGLVGEYLKFCEENHYKEKRIDWKFAPKYLKWLTGNIIITNIKGKGDEKIKNLARDYIEAYEHCTLDYSEAEGFTMDLAKIDKLLHTRSFWEGWKIPDDADDQWLRREIDRRRREYGILTYWERMDEKSRKAVTDTEREYRVEGSETEKAEAVEEWNKALDQTYEEVMGTVETIGDMYLGKGKTRRIRETVEQQYRGEISDREAAKRIVNEAPTGLPQPLDRAVKGISNKLFDYMMGEQGEKK
jgi:hypothetical protein